MADQRLTGMAYVPGTGRGRLHIGAAGADAQCIVLITQDQVEQIGNQPAGVLVTKAAPFSHPMIGLLGRGVPTVLISESQAATLTPGMAISIDGASGLVTTGPDSVTPPVTPPVPPAAQPLSSADGESVHLYASVRNPTAARHAVENGAEAIGLVRSEFLLPQDGRRPDREFYEQAFAGLCEAARPLSVTVRLLDIAADKMPPWLTHSIGPDNPLGLQGVRVYAQPAVKEVVAAQLQALRVLSQRFALRVLIPYLTRDEELAHWLAFVRARLPESVPVGAMVETPAGALDVGSWLTRADFIAVGCNDLMQCLFAVDRDQPALGCYLDPYAPVLYRLLQQLARQGGERCSRIQLCGVLSQLQGVLPILLGLGFRVFSVDAPFIPHLAQTIQQCRMSECQDLADRVCRARRTREVRERLELPGDVHPPFLS